MLESGISKRQQLKQKWGSHKRKKMLVGPYVVEVVDYDGEPLVPKDIIIKVKHACGSLVRDNVRIIYDDWRTVSKIDKDFIWDN